MSIKVSGTGADPERFDILGVGISMVNLPQAVETIAQWIEENRRTYVCVANTHGVTQSQRDPDLKRIHNEAGMVTPDGMPLVWVSRLAGWKQTSRVYGPDLLLAMCEAGVSRGYRHYFYGGGHGVARLLVSRLEAMYPGLCVAGLHSPPFRDLSPEEDEQAVRMINDARPDIVWVGLGAPKQEQWMASHRNGLVAPVLIGVGAAFDFHAGVKRQAPRWMQHSGLEWAFRLGCEPRRLWKRYAVNITSFGFYLTMEYLGLSNFQEAPRRELQGGAQ